MRTVYGNKFSLSASLVYVRTQRLARGSKYHGRSGAPGSTGPLGGASPAAARERRIGKRDGAIMSSGRVRMEPWGSPPLHFECHDDGETGVGARSMDRFASLSCV